MKSIHQAVSDAYDDCIAVAKDFSGQGVLIQQLLRDHKKLALFHLERQAPDARDH